MAAQRMHCSVGLTGRFRETAALLLKVHCTANVFKVSSFFYVFVLFNILPDGTTYAYTKIQILFLLLRLTY